MDLLLIIYIFVLFVIFSPNFIFQSSFKNHMVQTLVHGLLFSVIFYVTYSQIGMTEKEGATIGTYESKPSNVKYDIETQNSSLGSLVPIENESLDKTKTLNNQVIIDDKNDRSLDKLTKSPPYDYINFRNYDYENMKKRVQLLDSHKHSNQYYDLVPTLGKKQDEILQSLNSHEMELSKIDMFQNNIKNRIKDSYQTDLKNIKKELDALWDPKIIPNNIYNDRQNFEKIAEELEKYKKRIENIGNVNLEAIEEYEKTKTRYDFFVNQQEDLLKAIDDLHKVINKINKISQEKFIGTFNAINEKWCW